MENNEATQQPVEATEQGNPTETPATTTDASQSASEPPRLSIDDLLDQHLSGEEFQKDKHKGVDYNKVLEELPSDAKKLIQNLREDYRSKTTKLSSRKKELEERERSLLSRKTEDDLRNAMSLPEDLDLYDPSGLQKFIEAKTAERLNSLLEPARMDLKRSERIEQVKSFEREHPDLNKYKPEIAKMITEKNVTIEDAYYMLKGREHKAALEQKNSEISQYKQAARDAGFKVSIGQATSQAKPKFKNAYEAYQWHQKQKAAK